MIDNNSDNPHPIAQSLRFPTEDWTIEEVKEWLKDNKIKYIKIEEAKEGEEMEKIFETNIKPIKEKQKVLTLPRGKFYIEKYDEVIEFNDEIFNDVINNFRDENLSKPFIDVNHKYEESYGDIIDMSIEEEGLYTYWVLNEKGIELIKNKQYKYISPAIYDIKDTKGELHKNVLVAVTLTNVPALLGALPQLQEQLQLSYFEKTEGGKRMEKTKQMYEKIKDVAMQKKWIELEDGEEKDFDTQVSEMLNVLYERMLALSDVAAQVESLLAEKKAVEEKLEAEKQKVASLEQEKLEREAKEVIQKAVEQGKYPVALFEMKVAQYLKDREMVMKEIELLPAIRTKKEGYSFEANDLTEEDINNMLRARLNPQNPADVKIYKQANKR